MAPHWFALNTFSQIFAGVNLPKATLEYFFAHPGSSRKKDACRKGGKDNANVGASQGPDEDSTGEATANLVNEEEQTDQHEDSIVEQVTANISMMLDRKLSDIIRAVTELSEKFNSLKDWGQ